MLQIHHLQLSSTSAEVSAVTHIHGAVWYSSSYSVAVAIILFDPILLQGMTHDTTDGSRSSPCSKSTLTSVFVSWTTIFMPSQAEITMKT